MTEVLAQIARRACLMCGIAGIYDSTAQADAAHVLAMTNAMAHRGPDASGIFYERCCVLGHRRLSVMDLSPSGNQPFYSKSQRYVMVYNGEVYNYLELAKTHQLSLKTTTDTEVVIELFERFGPDCVKLLNGMFAMAIYDRHSNQLFLFRDRMGIKPLFFTWNEHRLTFASELKALQAIHGWSIQQVVPSALAAFLNLGYIPAPATAYRQTYKLEPGHWASLEGRDFAIHQYWSLDSAFQPVTRMDEEEALHELDRIVVASVRGQMMSDVPFGTFLSGGIDSSLVTAVAQSLSITPISTFSMTFRDAAFNEGPHALLVARHLQTNHHEFVLEESDALQLLSDTTLVYDEPYADTSAAPTMWLSAQTRRSVTMVLSGDGGDELFLGYGAYTWAERMRNPLLWATRRLLASCLRRGNQRMQRVADLVQAPDLASLQQHIFSQEQYFFSGPEIELLLNPALADSFRPICFAPQLQRTCTPAERQALFDLHYYLPDDLLTKVDRASMRYGLEARVPLLDHHLVEFAINLDPALRKRGKTTKYLLKKLLYRYLPEEFFLRPKRGFSIPLAKWLRGGLSHLRTTYLDPDLVHSVGFLRADAVGKLHSRFLEGESRLAQRLWALIVVQKWMTEQQLRF